MNWTKYNSTLPIAEELYSVLYSEPKTHREVAEKFNKVGDINRLIHKAIELCKN